MTKRLLYFCLALSTLLVLSSCGSVRTIVPQAASSFKSVSFKELNLTGKDYEVLNRIEASARIEVTLTNTYYTIKDPEGSFSVNFEMDKKSGKWVLKNYEGVVRAGYLSDEVNYDGPTSPSEYAHRMAIYRIINLVKEQGGDGIIEPVVSSSVEDNKSGWGKTTYTLLTTVSGKIIRLKNSNN